MIFLTGYSGIHSKAFGLMKLTSFLKVVFESDTYNRDKPHDVRKKYISQYYKVGAYRKVLVQSLVCEGHFPKSYY